jgi:hypothetical protein
VHVLVQCLLVLINMHGETNIKYINAQQAGLIYKYHNIKHDDGQLTGRNTCRAWFFKTINVLIVSACVGIVFTRLKV